MSGGVSTPRYLVLDSLRGLCAVMVVLFHMKATGMVTSLPIVRNAWLFVDFFFVLSGFVIAAGYQEKLARGFPIHRFMFLRLARVYPLYIVVLLLFLAAETAKSFQILPGISLRPPFTSPRSIPELWENLALVQIFGLRDNISWNLPAWSIAAEVWAYLLAAVVFARTPRLVMPIALVTIVAALTALALTGDGFLDRTFSMALVRCLLGFACGVIAFNLVRQRGLLPTTTMVEAAVVIGVIAFVCFADGYATLAAPFVFVIAVAVFASERGAVSAGLRWGPLVFLGMVSYSIYMTHTFVLARCIDILLVLTGMSGVPLAHVAQSETGPAKLLGVPAIPWLGDVLTLLVVGVCIAVAWATHRWIEKPIQDWSKRRVKAPVALAEQAPVAF